MVSSRSVILDPLQNDSSGVFWVPKLLVQGDTNGDSVVDALDVADVEKTVNGNYELYDEFYLAADLDCDEGISMTDYQQVVNRALTS